MSEKFIGSSVPRKKAKQLAAGAGAYTADKLIGNVAHVAYFRSPYAHALIKRIDLAEALAQPGVIAVFQCEDLLAVCKPWSTRYISLPGHRSPPQTPLANGRAVWQGQPVAMVVAESRALAEDAVASIDVEWVPLSAVSGADKALQNDAPLIHSELGSNILFKYSADSGSPDEAFSKADHRIEREFRFSRHTGVPLEPRTIVAEFDATQRCITIHASMQAPHQIRAILSEQFGIEESRIRIIVPDVGGGFGIKLHAYDDEIAVVAAAMLLKRPVKYVSDRHESFVSDVHARCHSVTASIGFNADGQMVAFSTDDRMEGGAFSIYPRASVLEGMRAVTAVGGPYSARAHSAKLRIAFQNKPPVGSYRGVGQPIACAVTEMLVDAAARQLQRDPAEFRRENYRSAIDMGNRTPGGLETGGELSFVECLEKLLKLMDYAELRRAQQTARREGRYLGIGLATFLENSASGPMLYGGAGIPIAGSDGCSIRLEPSGALTCVTSSQFQGQGLETALAQVIADIVGVPMEMVSIINGDTSVTPVGGGSWASRGMTIGGSAAHKAATAMRDRILEIAAVMLQHSKADLEIRNRAVLVRGSGASLPLSEIGFTLHYRQHLLPPNLEADPVVTRHFASGRPYYLSNGIQGSMVEVDVLTGFIRPLRHWVVEDCGRVINPMLVDEQLRGGIVQGIGAALYEELHYDEEAQLLNASMADYLVPMAAEMPDIEIDHVETLVDDNPIGTKGVGEAGLIGASAAVGNAVNDALSPLGCELTQFPMTPLRVLRALKKVS